MQPRTAFLCATSLLTVLTGCGGGGSNIDRRLHPGDRSLGGYAHSRRRCADDRDYCITGERLYRECERGCRFSARRRHGLTDDPIHGSRFAAADHCDCGSGCGGGKRQHLLQGTSGSLSHSVTAGCDGQRGASVVDDCFIECLAHLTSVTTWSTIRLHSLWLRLQIPARLH